MKYLLKIQSIIRYILIIAAAIRYFTGDILHCNTQILTLTLLILSFLSIDYKKFDYKFYIVILFFIFIAFTVNGGASLGVIVTFLIASSCRSISIRRMSGILCILQICFLYYMNYKVSTLDIISHNISYDKGSTTDLGFGNSNSLSLFISSILYSFYIWTENNSIRPIILLIVLVGSILGYFLTVGRTIFIGELCFFMVGVMLCLSKNTLYRFKYVIAYAPAFITIVLISILFYMSDVGVLNKLLTGRIVLWARHLISFIDNGSILWGYEISDYFNQPLDCSYITLFIYLGGIGYFAYCYFYIKSVLRNYSYLIKFLPVICGMLISGLTENVLLPLSPINLIFTTLLIKAYYGIKHCPVNYNSSI